MYAVTVVGAAMAFVVGVVSASLIAALLVAGLIVSV